MTLVIVLLVYQVFKNSILSFRHSKIERQAYSYVFRYSTCSSSVRLNKKSKCVISTSFTVLAYVSSCFVASSQPREITLGQHPPIASVQAKEAQNILEPTSLAKSFWSRSPGSLLNSPRHCQHRMTTLDVFQSNHGDIAVRCTPDL